MLEARADQTITIPSEERPLNIVFDKGGWVLKELTHQKPTEEWLYQLRHGDAGDRIGALQALAHVIDRTEIREVVAHALAHDQFWGVRREAATALGKSSDSSASELLTRALRDPDAKVRLSAVAALKGFETRVALAALQQVLSDDSSYAVVAEAIGSLVQLDPSHGMSYCEKGLSLDSHNDVVRAASAKAMGTLKTVEARNRLFGLTSYGQRRDVRIAALEALADNWRNDEEVRRRIEDLVDDPKHHVRRKALEKLGAIASEKSRTVLVDLCNREADALLRREARRALASIDRVLQSKPPIH
jgi:aminopeptidase N